MTSKRRGFAAILTLASFLFSGCSGGVSVPAAGTTPSGGSVTPTATPTMAPGTTATPTTAPGTTATPTTAPGVTATPTMAPGVTATPTMAPGVTATPTMAPGVTATPTMAPVATTTPTLPPGATATPTMAPGATATPTPLATSTPITTPVPTSTPSTAPVATPTPVPTPVPTMAAGACVNPAGPSNPAGQPVSTSEPFPVGAGGGTITLPKFADQVASVHVSGNSAAADTETIQESQTPFTDAGGNGNIPTAPSGYTGISYTGSFLSTPQTINFTDPGLIVISASAPCEIMAGKTYAAFAYVNGGFSHLEFGPGGLGDTTPFPATTTTSGGVTTISFTINLSKNEPTPNQQPSGDGLEVDLAVKN